VHPVKIRWINAIDGPEIVLETTDAICIHALAPLLHYVGALRDGADSRKLGLSKEKDFAYIVIAQYPVVLNKTPPDLS
jgi:hypothetical protein